MKPNAGLGAFPVLKPIAMLTFRAGVASAEVQRLFMEHRVADYFVSVSHDGFIDIEVRTQEMRDKALEILGHEMDEGSVEILIASRCPTTARSLLP